MKRLVALALVAGTIVSAVAEDQGGEKKKTRKQVLIEERMGGYVERPDKRTGKVYVVNAQKQIQSSEFKNSVKRIGSLANADINIVDGEAVSVGSARDAVKKLGAVAAVFIVNDPACGEMSLVAREGKWAIVNVAPLVQDQAGDAFFVARTRKVLIRTLLSLCGVSGSPHANPIFGNVSTAKDLDKIADEQVPIDAIAGVRCYLEALGVETRPPATYLVACREGWAPKPVNKFQEEVWNRVHKLPSKPLKIEYNEKRDAGK